MSGLKDNAKPRLAIRPNGAGNRTCSAPYKENCELVDLSDYTGIRLEDGLVVAQAKVTMSNLVKFTMKNGCIPKVVAEFREITVGGAISGASLESTSHRHGQVMDCVAWLRVRTGDGSEVIARRGDSLWCSLSGTFGTMGIVLEAAIECVPVPAPFVRVSYFCHLSVESVVSALLASSQHEISEDTDEMFLEGLEFPKEQVTSSGAAVVIQGRMLQDPTAVPSKIGWRSQTYGGPFYYEHVRELVQEEVTTRKESNVKLKSSARDPFFEEVIPLEDFLFRYDLGAFWMARPMAFEPSKFLSYLPFIIGLFVASYQYVRYLTGALFTTSHLFQALKAAPQAVVASKMIVQDFYMPPGAVAPFVTAVREKIPLSSPLWLCPVKSNTDQPFTPSYEAGESGDLCGIFINCGVYGRVPDGKARDYTKELERLCQLANGRKMMYAQSFYSKECFWEIHDRQRYNKLRQEHGAEGCFPDLYEKSVPPIPARNPWSILESIASLFL